MSKKNLSDMEKFYNNCFRKYAGLPKFISRQLILDQAHVRSYGELMLAFAKKRFFNLVAFSPFGDFFRNSANENDNSTYGSPCNKLLT